MAVVNSWDVNNNFWILHPQFLMEEVFVFFYKDDKSKDKTDSSRVMWSVAYVYDNDSQYINWTIKDRIKFADEEILKKKGAFSETKYKKLIDGYNSFQDSAAKRQLKEWERILDEKTDLMKTMKYDLEHWEILEKMLTSNSKLYSELERITMLLDKEGTQDRAKGGSEESLSEKGELDVD